ncbi:hypothetical protein [Microbacterium sp. Bi128]|uniref:hypothetical protein n=1 Tax=Microbacterium sp. Bi128 TaxID=2821115 RepID=UPI001E0D10A1|nr:hypothetical protein [Microbacterium sp. Bi128]CAH0257949.1 hypothetical protein SRABI128_03071 [Microbacterium sp. Bi128]
MSEQSERRACEYCSARDQVARNGHVCIIDVLQVAVDGGQVVVAGTSAVQHVFRDLEQLLRSHERAVTRISRRNGCESITLLSGGRVRFARSASALAGMSADVVFMAGDRDAMSGDLVDSARYVVSGSHVPQPVRWLAW